MTPEREKELRGLAAHGWDDTLTAAELLAIFAALDEARRERDEKTRMLEVIAERVGATTFNALLVEIARLVGAVDAARAAAIEECAKVLDAREEHWALHERSTGPASSLLLADESRRIATRLRALLEPGT